MKTKRNSVCVIKWLVFHFISIQFITFKQTKPKKKSLENNSKKTFSSVPAGQKHLEHWWHFALCSLSLTFCACCMRQSLTQGLSKMNGCHRDIINKVIMCLCDVKSLNSALPCMQDLLVSVKLFSNSCMQSVCAGMVTCREGWLQERISPAWSQNSKLVFHAILEQWPCINGNEPLAVSFLLGCTGWKLGANPALHSPSGKWSYQLVQPKQ